MASKKKVNAAKKKKAAPALKKKAPARKAAPRSKKKAAPAKKKQASVKKAPARKAPARKPPVKAARPSSQQPTITPKERMHRQVTPVVDVVEALKQAPKKALAPTVNLRGPALVRPAPAPEPEGSDRRIFLRVPYGAWVNVVRDGRQEFCLARDISMGGVFLKANPPPQLGELIRLLLVIENDNTPLELQGLVVRRSESEGGFGIRFENLEPSVENRLREVVADASAALWKPPAGSPTSAPLG